MLQATPRFRARAQKIQQMGGSSFTFTQKYSQTWPLPAKSTSQVSKETSLFSWGTHKHVTALQAGQAGCSIQLEVQEQGWAVVISTLHQGSNEGTSLYVLSGTPGQATQDGERIHAGAPHLQWCSGFFRRLRDQG